MSKLLLILITVCVTASVIADTKEIKSIEDLDLIDLLKNEKQRKQVFACLMDQAPCGNLQQFKESITQMIRTDCKNCSLKEKERYDMFTQLLSVAYPDKLNALKRKTQN